MTNSTFGKRLKSLREDKGLAQSELARLADVSPSLINLMESGQRSPSLATLQDLADALGTSIDYLVGRADKPTADQVPAGNGPLASAYRKLASLSPDKQEQVDSLLKTMQQQEKKKDP
jgi:transcriptional regulator with XRE-family HTH domain